MLQYFSYFSGKMKRKYLLKLISLITALQSYSFRHKIKSVKVIIDKHFRDACHIDVLTVHLRSCCCFLQSVCLLGMCCLFCRVDSIMLVEEGFNMVSVDASDKMLKYALKSRWERRKEPAFDKWGMACLIQFEKSIFNPCIPIFFNSCHVHQVTFRDGQMVLLISQHSCSDQYVAS